MLADRRAPPLACAVHADLPVYLAATNSLTSWRTWRTVQPHEAASSSWVIERQAPVSSTAQWRAGAALLRPRSGGGSVHAVAFECAEHHQSRCTNEQAPTGFLG